MVAGSVERQTEARPGVDRAALAIAVAIFLLHAALAGRYDIFRDELYFIVCGQYPSFGYVDQPPLVPLLAAGLYAVDHGAWLLRLPVAIVSALLVYLVARFARLLGGGSGAALIAALAAGIAPMLLGMGAILNTTAFDPLAWTAIAYLLVRAIRLGDDRALLPAGLVAGIDLEIKYALVFWAVGLGLGLLATPERRIVLRSRLWIGLALGAVIALPSLVWQAAHGFPFLELSAAARAKNADTPILPFILNQVFVMNPLLAPLWIAGLVGPFAVRGLKDVRFVPIAYVVVFAIVRMGGGKDYYLAACYPALFAIGAVVLAGLAKARPARIALGAVMAGALALSALIAPVALPILPPQKIAGYIAWLGVAPQQQERSFRGTALPQVFADQLGWHDFTDQVVAAWQRIPAAERPITGIKVDNYGEAASLDLYGRARGLPPSLAGHNHYFMLGLRGQKPVNLLVVQEDLDDLRPYCAQVRVLGTTHSPLAMAYENGKVIAYCQGVKPPLEVLWPQLKDFS